MTQDFPHIICVYLRSSVIHVPVFSRWYSVYVVFMLCPLPAAAGQTGGEGSRGERGCACTCSPAVTMTLSSWSTNQRVEGEYFCRRVQMCSHRLGLKASSVVSRFNTSSLERACTRGKHVARPGEPHVQSAEDGTEMHARSGTGRASASTHVVGRCMRCACDCSDVHAE